MAALISLCASLLWGTADYSGGILTKKLNPFLVVTITQSIAAGLAFILWLANPGDFSPGRWMLYAALSGISVAIAVAAFYEALASGRMGVIAPLASSGVALPVIVGVIGGDQITVRIGWGLGIAMIGAVLASGPELSGAASRRSVLLATVAAIGFGSTLAFMSKAAIQGVSAAVLVSRVSGLVLIAGIFWFFWRAGRITRKPSRPDAPYLLISGVGDLSAVTLFGWASTMGAVSVVAVLSSLYSVVTIILAALLLKERLAWVQWLGVICALMGVGLIVA